MQILPSTTFQTGDRVQIAPDLIHRQDRVEVVARPQPERALFFTLGSLIDKDLRRPHSMRGVITQLDLTAHQFVPHRRRPDIVVDVTDRTPVSRGGKRLALSDLTDGQRVSVAGILNDRINEMVRTDRILIEE